MSRTLLLVILAMLSALLAAGCHEERAASATASAVGGKNMEGDIRDGIKQQLEVDVTVECPEDLEKHKGDEFECDAALEGEDGTFPVAVTQTDDKGNIEWEARAMRTDGVEESIAADILEERKLTVEVECPEAVALVADTGFECVAIEESGDETTVNATVTAEDGSVSWET